jgi:DNA-binding PadR family transcriptional regulator
MHGRAHGYAIQRELVAWRIDTWTLVRTGSIYHALKQLTVEGKLRAVGNEPGGRGPGRSIYELTPVGEAEFVALLEAALRSFRLDELGAGVAFMQDLPRDRVLELLRDQHRRASDVGAGLDAMKADFPDRDAPPHTADLLALWSDGLAATARWTGALITRLEDGAYVMADDRRRDEA